MLKLTPTAVLSAAALALLAGCGGGSSSGTPAPVDPPPVTPPVTPPPPNPPPPDPPPPVTPPPVTVVDVENAMHRCEKPRLSTPQAVYPDQQGTLADEKTFLRLWLDLSYLWRSEIPALDAARYSSAVGYFNDLKTPQLSPSGKAKDRYHFSYPDERWAQIARNEQYGYGISWVRNRAPELPRNWRITMVEEDTPAARAGLRRGDRLLMIDGEDFVNGNGAGLAERIDAALFPSASGQAHTLVLERDGQRLEANLLSLKAYVAPVRDLKVIDTGNGKVGYLAFRSHSNDAEGPLVKAVTQLKEAGISDLVLDMRYNGGGQLQIAGELAYMIAGAQATAGKTFEQLLPNERLTRQKPMLFPQRASGLSAPVGIPLPTLDLKRVTVLTGPGTCSASESLINGLRGVDVEVNLIGGQTCGKPYAFIPTANCGTTYFAIQYRGINHKGFGDFSDGFAPTCRVDDDLGAALGDPAEGMLAAALKYRASGACPAPRSARAQAAALPALVPARPQAAEISIYAPPK
ncbi:S41 family peptidase [Pseudoduganella violacea]|uniref:PDZ domain-containing protein n=1 Tax=Pseudoduganella violacea TaxID=1715466 RepID=A0A7W5BFG2_9BURK|nr:S41 family peptidase [Pseudoduganella violacea]MBB3121915.1 hypothetical protein [Pseudoduganella violacea]